MTFTSTFLATHQAFTSTPVLLQLVIDRSGSKGPRVMEVFGLCRTSLFHQKPLGGLEENGQVGSPSFSRLEALECHSDELERTKG